MFQQTDTKANPWTIIDSNNKKVGRINTFKTILKTVEYRDKPKPRYFEITEGKVYDAQAEIRRLSQNFPNINMYSNIA